LKSEGFRVDAIAPMAAIYLTVQFDLKGLKTVDGKELSTTEEVTSYLLSEAGLAVVPFYAFGTARTSSWYRLSVGTASVADVNEAIESLRKALSKLS
jgi:aspartate aminotransferase